jgi:hypothetical protein
LALLLGCGKRYIVPKNATSSIRECLHDARIQNFYCKDQARFQVENCLDQKRILRERKQQTSQTDETDVIGAMVAGLIYSSDSECNEPMKRCEKAFDYNWQLCGGLIE